MAGWDFDDGLRGFGCLDLLQVWGKEARLRKKISMFSVYVALIAPARKVVLCHPLHERAIY